MNPQSLELVIPNKPYLYPHFTLFPLMQLETGRLILREFRITDEDAVHEYGSDPQVVKFMSWGPNTKEETRNFIDTCIKKQSEDPRRSFELAIELKEENKLIGGCGIRASNPVHSEGNIGYVLNKEYWGMGIATETSLALLRFGFGELKLHRIYAMVDPDNFRSSRVLEKIGMTQEGRLRENLIIHGEYRDSLMFSILKHEWKQSYP